MCSSPLAVREASACVQSRPNEAITITLVDQQQITAQRKKKDCFLPGWPDPEYTLPTTQYRTSKALPGNMRLGDFFRDRPEHAHRPLVVLLWELKVKTGCCCEVR